MKACEDKNMASRSCMNIKKNEISTDMRDKKLEARGPVNCFDDPVLDY